MVISNWVEKKLAEREKRREQELIARVRAETETRVRAETEDRVRAETEDRVRSEAIAEGSAYERAFQDGFRKGRAYERRRMADESNGDDTDKAIADSLLRNNRNDHVSARIDADKMQA